MVENDYPIPSYMADLFQKPLGWVETPEPPQESLLSSSEKKARVYAIDCEMVGDIYLLTQVLLNGFPVHD